MSEPERQACPQCGLVYRIKKSIPGKTRLCRKCGVELQPVAAEAEVAPLAAVEAEAARAAVDSAAALSESGAAEPSPADDIEKELAAMNSTSALSAREAVAEHPPGASSRRMIGKAVSPSEEMEANLASMNLVSSYTAQNAIPAPPPIRPSERRLLPPGTRGVAVSPSENLEADLAAANALASDSIRNVAPAAAPSAPAGSAAPANPKEDAPAPRPAAGGGVLERRFLELASRLEESMRRFDAAQADRFQDLEGKVLHLSGRDEAEPLSILTEKVRETGDLILARLKELREGEEWTKANATIKEELADLVKTTAALTREQGAHAARMETLAGEIRTATKGLADLDEWRGGLPDRVADEIGRTVEARVVGPISGALARQAPVILAELQDGKLVDIVSRAVREAQRPLLREILAGGRGGVPIWLFASILLPLLLILGYLFLPGDEGAMERDAAIRATAASLTRLESEGVPLTREVEERLGNVETAVTNLHGEAMNHARNAAALEEQTRGLTARLEEKEALINEYRDTLQRQVRLLNAYRTRLTQLGVPPESIQE